MKAVKILFAALLVVAFVSVGANAQTWTNRLRPDDGSESCNLLETPTAPPTYTVTHTVDATNASFCWGEAWVSYNGDTYVFISVAGGYSDAIFTSL